VVWKAGREKAVVRGRGGGGWGEWYGRYGGAF
jgi:hypothetical protein